MTPVIEEKKNRLKQLIREYSLVTKNDRFIANSLGQDEAWLFDLRNLFMKSEALELVADIFWDEFKDYYPFQVGGQEVAAIPLVTAIILKGNALGKIVNGFIIRKSRKPVGLQKIIEGELNSEKVILVDDLINSGGTILKQIKVIENEEKKIDRVFTLINFRGAENQKLLNRYGISLNSLFSLEDFNLSLFKRKSEISKDNFEVLWRFASPNPNYFYIIPKSSPCLDDKKIYFGSDSGFFWALNQNDGSIAWKFEVGYPALGKKIFSSPALFNDKVFFGSYDGNLYALNKSNGEKVWVFNEADWIGSSPAIAEDLKLVFIGLEFGLFRKMGGIAAINANSGKKVWEYRTKDYIHSSPAYCEEKRLLAVGDGGGFAYLFDAKSGNLKWKFPTGGPIRASFAFDLRRNLVIFGSFDKNMYIVDIESGKLKKKFETKDYINSSPEICGDDVYFTSTDKNLYSANIETGQINWSFSADSRIFSSPMIIGEKIYFGANNGIFYEIELKTGECTSQFQTAERITNQPACNPLSDNFFVSTYANEIYCLRKKQKESQI